MTSLIPRSAIIPILLLAAICGLGTVGYIVLEDASLFDAFYMTIITMSTVGFSEVVPVRTPATMLLTVALILFGIGVFFWVVNEMAQFTIRNQIQANLGRRSLNSILRALKQHYIVCGYGRMGQSIVNHLTEQGVPFVVIDPDEDIGEALRDADLPFLIGDASDEEVLHKARIDRATGLIACTGSDAVNVYITLTARTILPDLMIVARYDDQRAEDKLRSAGANRVVSPYQIGAERVTNTLLRPTVMHFMDTAIRDHSSDLEIDQVCIPANSHFVGKSLAEQEIRKHFSVVVIAIQRANGGVEFNPGAEVQFQADDVIVLLGERQDVEKLTGAVNSTD